MSHAAMNLAVSLRIHSFLGICSSALLPALLRIAANLQINYTPSSFKATSLLESIIPKPYFTPSSLKDYLSEFVLQISGEASKFVFQHVTKLRRKESNSAELERQGPLVSAPHRLVSWSFDRQQSPTSRLTSTTQGSGPQKASGHSIGQAHHREHLLCGHKPSNIVSFPTIATKPQRRSTHLTERLSNLDPLSLLDDKTAAEILALVPDASGFCLWSSGELQILAPHLTIGEAAELELPESGRISISVSRWSPKPTGAPGPSLSKSPDNDVRLLKMMAENASAQGPPPAPNRNPGNTASVIDSSSSILQVETLLGERKAIAAKAHQSGSLSPKMPDRSSISWIEESNSLHPGTSKIEPNQLYHNGDFLPLEHALCELDSSTGRARHASMQDAPIVIGSGKTQSRVLPMNGDHRDSPYAAEAAPNFTVTPPRFSSRCEPVRHGDAGPSLPRALTAINGSAETKSIVAPQARRPSSAPQFGLAPVAQTTPPVETPPPANPEPPPPQPALAPVLPPRRMNNDSRIFVGPRTHCATAGVKIRRRNGDGDQYLTISTHAAFNGVNEKPIPVCVPKKSNFLKKLKPVRGVAGESVLDAGDSSWISHIHSTFNTPNLLANPNPVFPNDFCENISLVGPLNRPPIRLREDKRLSWNMSRRFNEVPVKIIGDSAQSQAFILGTFYSKPFPVHCGNKKPVDLVSDVISRSVMFVRNYLPLQNEHIWSGAPVVTGAADGTFSEVVGFYAFQFGPPNGVAEDLKMGRRKLEKMIQESKLTMCGAIMPSNEFKMTWEIVPGNE